MLNVDITILAQSITACQALASHDSMKGNSIQSSRELCQVRIGQVFGLPDVAVVQQPLEIDTQRIPRQDKLLLVKGDLPSLLRSARWSRPWWRVLFRDILIPHHQRILPAACKALMRRSACCQRYCGGAQPTSGTSVTGC